MNGLVVAKMEDLINRNGLDTVLYAVELACMARADDAESSRPGSPLAANWVRASNAVNNARGEINERCGVLPPREPEKQ